MNFIHFSDPGLGRLARFGRVFCRHAAVSFPHSPLCARLACNRISRETSRDRCGLWAPFTLDRFEGGGTLRLSNRLGLELLECILGGRPARTWPERPLTPVERSLASRMTGPLMRAWEHAFEDLAAFEPSDEEVLGACVTWHMNVDVELSLDESCAFALAREFDDPPADPVNLLSHLLAGASPLEVSVASPTIALGDVGRLRPGVVFPLDSPLDRPWTLLSAGSAIASVRPAAVHDSPHLIVTERTTP